MNPEPTIPFRRTVAVRFDEADARGILFYGRLHMLAHRVFEEFVTERVVGQWSDWFESDAFMVPIRQAQAAFQRPMRPGQHYIAELVVSKVGESSFEVTTRFFECEDEGLLCAETRVTHVFAEPERFQRIPIPPGIRSRLQAHLAQE